MRVKTLLRAVHGKPLSEAKSWKEAEAKFNEAVAEFKKRKVQVKKDANEAQALIAELIAIAEGVSLRIGDVSADLIDSGRSGVDRQVEAIESLQDTCDDMSDMYGHDALMSLEYITNKAPTKKYRSTGTTKGQFEAELRRARALAKEARRLVKAAHKDLESSYDKCYAALDAVPDDDPERVDRLEGRLYGSGGAGGNVGDADEYDSWLDGLENADVNLEYIS